MKERGIMESIGKTRLTRSKFLRASLLVPAAYLLAVRVGQSGGRGLAATPAQAQTPDAAPAADPSSADPANQTAAPIPQALIPTPPSVDADDTPTSAETEGPYFKPDSPERTSLLEPGMAGTTLELSGLVLSTSGQPIAGALLDFWQADASGQYDNAGYGLRGHQYTDDSGNYQLETVVPGLYPGRTRHIHVKVQAPNQPILTTQLYFPNEPRNASDGLFLPQTVITEEQNADGSITGTFNFVLSLQ